MPHVLIIARSYGTQSPIQFSILTHARYEYAEFILSQYNLETAAIESHPHFPFLVAT